MSPESPSFVSIVIFTLVSIICFIHVRRVDSFHGRASSSLKFSTRFKDTIELNEVLSKEGSKLSEVLLSLRRTKEGSSRAFKQQKQKRARKVNKEKNEHEKLEFRRTNRIDGINVWVNELRIIQRSPDISLDQTGVGLVVELAKELLYSGIPEQVLELYAAYKDIIISNRNSGINEVDMKLVFVTIRAFLSLEDVDGALSMLATCERSGLQFDIENFSIILKEMAEASSEGLKTSVRLWEELKLKTNGVGKKVLSVTGYCGILSGIIKHGLSRGHPGSLLLLDSLSDCEESAKEQDSPWYMSLASAEAISKRLVEDYVASTTVASEDGVRTLGKKVNYKVLHQYLRLSYRVGATKARVRLNDNFELDKLSDQQERAKEGLRQALMTMEEYCIPWTLPVADILIEEGLRLGDVASVEFVVRQMRQKNILSRTSTFNTLLKQYSNTYDGESAYYLLESMKKDRNTMPNVESYRLVLKACSRSDRGKYFSDIIVKNLISGNQMFKEAWDRCLEHQIIFDFEDTKGFETVLMEMVASGTQPDEDTVMMLYDAYNRAGNLHNAVRLYQQQANSEIQRRLFRESLHSQSSNTTVVNFQYLGKRVMPLSTNNQDSEPQGKANISRSMNNVYAYLPPPSVTSTCHLLELLRDAGYYSVAAEIVDDMLERSLMTTKNVPITTQSGKVGVSVTSLPLGYTSSGHSVLSRQYAPNRKAFVLAMEACLNLDGVVNEGISHIGKDKSEGRQMECARRAEVAINIFNKMEQIGIEPDRRTYAALIKVFGLLQEDVASALGVFDEMRTKFVPDVENLQSVLQVCRKNPLDLRTMCVLLETMLQESETGDTKIDLDVFSKDILMQTFPDALTLGQVLESMEKQPMPRGTEVVYTGISVLSVFAQALRKKGGVESLIQVMLFLGSCGIHPDKETMEYFRPVEVPEKNSFGSRDYFKLQPHKLKQRSLMDITTSSDMKIDPDLPSNGFQRSPRVINADRVPYFESRNNAWGQHEAALRKAAKSDSAAFDDDDDDDDDDDSDHDAKKLESHFELEHPHVHYSSGDASMYRGQTVSTKSRRENEKKESVMKSARSYRRKY